MDAAKKARVLNRNRAAEASQSQRGDRQIVLPMSQEQFDDCWHDAAKMRKLWTVFRRKTPSCSQPVYGKAMPFTALAARRKNATGYACERFARVTVPRRITCGQASS